MQRPRALFACSPLAGGTNLTGESGPGLDCGLVGPARVRRRTCAWTDRVRPDLSASHRSGDQMGTPTQYSHGRTGHGEMCTFRIRRDETRQPFSWPAFGAITQQRRADCRLKSTRSTRICGAVRWALAGYDCGPL